MVFDIIYKVQQRPVKT